MCVGLVLGGCASSPLGPKIPESGTANPLSAAPVRSREVERLLDGSYRTPDPLLAGHCARERRLVFQDGRMELIENIPLEPLCREIRGQVIYRGRVEVGELLVKDASSRPLLLRVDEVEIMAISPGWGLTRAEAQQDPCELAQLRMGDRELVTGRECGAFGRFPARGETFASEIVVNSGQRIQLRHLPLVGAEPVPSVRRGVASGAEETLEFERTSL